jgi:ATP-binding cassette, subfamily B, bacterial
MSSDLDGIDAIAWPREKLGDGLARLMRKSSAHSLPGPWPAPGADVSLWIESAAAALGAEALATPVRGEDVGSFLRRRDPVLVRLYKKEGGERFLLLAGARGRSVRVLPPNGDVLVLSRRQARDLLCRATEEWLARETDAPLRKTPLSAELRARLREHLVAHRLRQETVADAFVLLPGTGASLLEMARPTRLPALVALFASTYALDYGLFLLSWWLLGRGVLSGDRDWRWLSAWAVLFAAMLPFRMLSTWSEGRIAVAAGGLLKERLLAGAMRLEPDELRSDGAGRHLARVFESEAVESLALSGGLLSAAAGIELLIAIPVLAAGAGGVLHALVLVATLGGFAFLARIYLRERRRWTDERLEITHDVVERMVGHRTRLAQERPERWHAGEDEALARYADRSRRVDRLQAILQSLPRLWLPIGIAALMGSFARAGVRADVELVAIGVGGTILASRALAKLVDGFSDLLDAVIAWGRVAPLFYASSRSLSAGDAAIPDDTNAGARLLEANRVSFRYPGRRELVLDRASFALERGDRVLLTSPSGGGKSTLVSLVNGLRRPDGGELLLDGLDGEQLGSMRWTRRVATAPQFHENHVFTETFAFNLLMGRRWPPGPGDWKEAETLCRELGLGELLEKMPGGMNQLVGDTGWQLSHGERSRLFLARALLQGGELVLLDESFAALDPENLRKALLCARERARSLLVVAHV